MFMAYESSTENLMGMIRSVSLSLCSFGAFNVSVPPADSDDVTSFGSTSCMQRL